MTFHWSVLVFLVPVVAPAVIIDRIAIIVENRLIKDSDIDREVRVTSYLNSDPLSLSLAERRKAAERLIDQAIIRREVELGDYPQAAPDEVQAFLKNIAGQKPAGSLVQYGLTEPELRDQVAWQLTVLHFIEQRFRPGVMVPEPEIEKYARQHPQQSRADVEELLTGQRVTSAFESWLNLAHKHLRIDYKEPNLAPGGAGNTQ